MNLDTLSSQYATALARCAPADPQRMNAGEWNAVEQVEYYYKRLVIAMLPKIVRQEKSIHRPTAQPKKPRMTKEREKQILRELGYREKD